MLWTLLAGGYLFQTLNPFGEMRKIHNLIDDITFTVLFGAIAFYSWKQYYKLKREKIEDGVNKVKEENNV
ncbi:MAG: hypothetical protein ACYSUP_02720 [Planctomycetota bacterium]